MNANGGDVGHKDQFVRFESKTFQIKFAFDWFISSILNRKKIGHCVWFQDIVKDVNKRGKEDGEILDHDKQLIRIRVHATRLSIGIENIHLTKELTFVLDLTSSITKWENTKISRLKRRKSKAENK